MDGWDDGRMMDGWMQACMDRWTGVMDGWMEDGQSDGWMDVMDGWMG